MMSPELLACLLLIWWYTKPRTTKRNRSDSEHFSSQVPCHRTPDW